MSRAHYNPAPRDVCDPTTVAGAIRELLELTRQRCVDGVRAWATLEMQAAHARFWARELGADNGGDDAG